MTGYLDQPPNGEETERRRRRWGHLQFQFVQQKREWAEAERERREIMRLEAERNERYLRAMARAYGPKERQPEPSGFGWWPALLALGLWSR